MRGATIAAWAIDFSWDPGAGVPTATTFELCIAEVGAICPRAGQTSPSAIVFRGIPADARRFHIAGEHLAPLLTHGQSKQLVWTLAACAPGAFTQLRPGVPPATNAPPMLCSAARPTPLNWTLTVAAPVLGGPQSDALINDRPQLWIAAAVEGAESYRFCVAHAGSSCSGSDVADDHEPRSIWVVDAGRRLALQGIEWAFVTEAPFWMGDPGDLPGSIAERSGERVSTRWWSGIEFSNNRHATWSAAACRAGAPCSWAAPRPLRTLPAPVPDDWERRPRYDGTPAQRFAWHFGPPGAPPDLTHYKQCLATAGSELTGPGSRWIGALPRVLRDLCSGDWPAGMGPAYAQALPQDVVDRCSRRPCEMPRPIKTWSFSGAPEWIIDLREHPDLAAYAGKDILWAVAACVRDLCTWSPGARSFRLPLSPGVPANVRVEHVNDGPVTIRWDGAPGDRYYVPCVRAVDGDCATGNRLATPRVNRPSGPWNAPRSCTLTGAYPQRGRWVVEVAACSTEWGCFGSAPKSLAFGLTRSPDPGREFACG